MTRLQQSIVEIARREVGVEEEPRGSNCGKRVNEYKATTTLDPTKGWPWCAAFVCWVVLQAMQAAGVKETATFKRPTTALAYGLESWSLAQDDSTQTKKSPGWDIAPADIFTLSNVSHTGIAVSAPDSKGWFDTVEGNTNDDGAREGYAVVKRRRHVSKVKARMRFKV